MAERTFNEVDVDFGAIEAALEKLPTPTITLGDVLERLRPSLVEQRKRGVSIGQMREVLKGYGVEIGERSLKRFVETGVLPGRKRAAVGEGEMQPVTGRTGGESGA